MPVISRKSNFPRGDSRRHVGAGRLYRAAVFAIAISMTGSLAAAPSRLAPALVLVLIGPPGTGKSTQAHLLSKKYKIPAISMSDLIKTEIGRRGALAGALKVAVASGELVNDNAANDLLKARILQSDAGRGFILDGYPRTGGQAKFLDAFLKENDLPAPKVILLDTPDDIVTKRMLARRRPDDQPEIIERRIKEYHEESKFLESWYRSENVMRVDGNAPIPQVAQAIDAQIESALAKRGFGTRQPDSLTAR